MGPRAIRNQERYLQQALKEREEEQKMLCQKDEEDIYESTAFAAQRHASEQLSLERIKRKQLQEEEENYGNRRKNSDGGIGNGHAITFWSHHLLTHNEDDTTSSSCEMTNVISNNTSRISMKRKSFSKCTSFTNDIHDGRLKHSCM